jgi:molybdate transport system substrate-binding protein
MDFSRRRLVAVSPVALTATVLTSGVARGATTTDLAVTCDAAAAAYRAKTGVRVRMYPTPPGLVLPQLEREIQNDLIVTRVTVIEQAEKAGLVKPNGRVGPWRNRLVTAAAREPAGPEGSFVVPDPSPGSDIDGAAILQRIGAAPATVVGVIDTGAVAWTLTNGGGRLGLLHRTGVVADDRLHAVPRCRTTPGRRSFTPRRSCSGSVPTRPPGTLVLSARTVIMKGSTCPRRCTRRR